MKTICKYYIQGCFHCDRIKDEYDTLSKQYKGKLEFESREITTSKEETKLNLHIYPTVVLYDKGKELGRLEGVITPEMLKGFVEEAV